MRIEIIFEFITTPQTKEINEMKEHLFFKEKYINYLQRDVQIFSISSQLNSLKVKTNIEQISNRILQEVFNDHPNAFWD